MSFKIVFGKNPESKLFMIVITILSVIKEINWQISSFLFYIKLKKLKIIITTKILKFYQIHESLSYIFS